MKDQFEQLLKQLDDLDITMSPNYITMKALANHLEAYYPNPEVVAASIKINVGQNFVDNTDLFERTVDAYVKCLSRMYSQMQYDFPRRGVAEQMFSTMIGSLKLDLTCTI